MKKIYQNKDHSVRVFKIEDSIILVLYATPVLIYYPVTRVIIKADIKYSSSNRKIINTFIDNIIEEEIYTIVCNWDTFNSIIKSAIGREVEQGNMEMKL